MRCLVRTARNCGSAARLAVASSPWLELSFELSAVCCSTWSTAKPPRDLPPGDTDDLARRGSPGCCSACASIGPSQSGEEITAVGGLAGGTPTGGRRGDAGGDTPGRTVRPLARPRLLRRARAACLACGGVLSGGERNRGLPRGGWRTDGRARGDPGFRRSLSSPSGRRRGCVPSPDHRWRSGTFLLHAGR